MKYRITGIPNRIVIEESEDGHNTLAQAYSRAKLLAGWPFAPNVEEVGVTELADLLRHVGIAR